jgi:hypothetical protein
VREKKYTARIEQTITTAWVEIRPANIIAEEGSLVKVNYEIRTISLFIDVAFEREKRSFCPTITIDRNK